MPGFFKNRLIGDNPISKTGQFFEDVDFFTLYDIMKEMKTGQESKKNPSRRSDDIDFLAGYTGEDKALPIGTFWLRMR